MAAVRHIVTPPGKAPIEFFAPEGATDGQLQQLASQALAEAFPSESFVTPVLDAATRKSLERAPRKLTQDEILSRQGDLTSRDPNMRERATEGITSALSSLGFSEGRQKAGRLADDVFDWTPAAALESGEEAVRDAAGGRYGEAIGNAAMAGLDIIPELGTAAKGGSALAMFLGRNAKTANLDALRQAEQMAEQGADKRQIWDETGWFQGKDKQWRFEISDEKFKVKDPQTGRQLAKAAGLAKAKELGYKGFDHVPHGSDDWRAVQEAINDSWDENYNGQPLSSIMSHPELEAAGYPNIERMTAAPLPAGLGASNGRFLPVTNQVQWKKSGRTAEQKRSTAAHEIQHGIQNYEGFSGGAQVGSAASYEGGAHYESAVRNRDHILKLLEDPNLSALSRGQLQRIWLSHAEKEVERAAQYEGYRRVGGEIEARNVQARLNMTPEERRATPPWETQDIPDEDQFAVFRGDGPQMSLDDPKPISADPSGTVPAASTLRAYRGLREPLDESRRTGPEFWSGTPEGASSYADTEAGGNVIPADLTLNNPFRLENDDDARKLADMLGTKWDYNPYWDLAEEPNFQEVLQAKGYDSAIFPDSSGSVDHPAYVTFDPAQARLGAFGPAPISADAPGTTPVPSALEALGPSKAAMATAKKLSTMAGSPAGANKKASTRQVKKLSEDYLRQVDQGKGGADWYEQSGRSIMEHMGEDEAAAVKLAGAIGVTSARTPVLPNLEHGVRGHMQAMAGDEIRTGGFPTAMGNAIQGIYDAPDIDLQGLRDLGNEAFGPKRTPFIQQNLMYEGFEPGQQSTARAVHDIWDMRARGYAGKDGRPFEGTPGTAQHRWADLQDQGYLIPEANARSIGGRADWDTGRLQAAAWVGNKIDALMREGKSFDEAQKIAVTDYSHGWNRLYANHNWESAPGSNTGHMAGFDELPWEEKKQYHGEVERAFLNPQGQSNIALGYGMPTGPSYDATGLYEGVVSPGTQDQIAVARGSGSQEIDPSSAKMMNALAATQGVLGAQKGAAWNFQSPAKSSIKGATGFRFDMDRTMSLEDIERFGPMIQDRFPAGNVGLLPDPAGMKVVKFWDEEGDDLPGFVREMTNEGGLPKPFPTTQSGNYMENAWDTPEGRFGGQYVNALRGLDIPGMEKKFDSFAPGIARTMVEDIDPVLIKRAGLTGSADIERLRKTIANEGWQGLVRLVESQKGSVEAKAALLAAMAGLAGVGAGGLLPDEAQQ